MRLYKWQHCHLTQQKLIKPIVACELGFLYNKEAIIEKLLDSKGNKDSSSSNNDLASHIKSLKVMDKNYFFTSRRVCNFPSQSRFPGNFPGKMDTLDLQEFPSQMTHTNGTIGLAFEPIVKTSLRALEMKGICTLGPTCIKRQEGGVRP